MCCFILVAQPTIGTTVTKEGQCNAVVDSAHRYPDPFGL
jgi:hypothetical protein